MGKLTAKQEAFAVAYVRNGGNGTVAAKEAGYGGNDVTLASVAYENLKKPQITNRIQAMTTKALVRAEEKGVASLEEALLTASTIMRARLGDFITEGGHVDIEALRAAPAGVVKRYDVDSQIIRGGDEVVKELEKVKFSIGDQLAAAQTIIKHHDGSDAPPPASVVNVAVILSDLPAELLRALAAHAEAR